MSTLTELNRSPRWTLAGLLALMVSLLGSQTSPAVDPAKLRPRDQAQAEDRAGQQLEKQKRANADAPPAGVRDRDQGVRDRHAEPKLDQGPAIQPWPHPRRWMLGVRVWYLNTGARVTQVFPQTPAWRVGLEPDDVIVSIDGYQIGYVNRRFYEISAELNARAGRTGWVRLLVQNCRNDQLVNVDVQLARLGTGFPRERFDLPPGARIDGADEPAGEIEPRRRSPAVDEAEPR